MSKKRRAKKVDPPAVPKATAVQSADFRWLTLWAWAASFALFLALAWPALNGLIYAGDDLDHFHLPLRQFYGQCLHDGDVFDWLPNIFCGFYLTGEGQVGTYHPLHLLLYSTLPLETAFNLEVFLSYPFMFAGMVLLLRRLDLAGTMESGVQAGEAARSSERLPMHAALFGAMLFTFSGFCLLHFMHMNGVAIVAHLPWLLWAIDILVRDSSNRRRVLAWGAIGLLTASQLLLGYPQYVWISLLAELFWLWLAWDRQTARQPAAHRGLTAMLLLLAAAKSIGALGGSIQLLQTYDHLQHAQRSVAGENVAHFAPLHPLNIVQFTSPYLLDRRVEGGNTQEFGLYAGAIPLLLLAWLFSRRKDMGASRKAVRALALFGVVAFVLALGKYGGLYYLQTLLPVVGNFRVSARYIVLVHLAIALLAAVALARMTGQPPDEDAPSWSGAWKLAGFSVLAAIVLRIMLPTERLSTFGLALLGPVIFGVAAAVVARAAARKHWARSLMLFLTAADIGSYGMSYVVFPGAKPLQAIVDSAPQAQPDWPRLATLQPGYTHGYIGNQITMRGTRLLDGYAGLPPANRLDYYTVPALRLANASLLRRNSDDPPFPGLQPYNPHAFAVPQPLPRVRLVADAVVSGNPQQDIARMEPQSLGATVLVDTPVELDGLPGEAKLLSDRPGKLQVAVDSPGRQMLVIADRYHEGWQAEIDGETATVYRAYGDFMGVVVAPGASTVQLTFRPDSLTQGRLLTAIGATAWGLCLLVGLVLARGQNAERGVLSVE
ncbi:MAG: YfhO family protein [Pirellulales bacterium]